MSTVGAALPHPLSQFVLKVHGRCDLACDHCYVYESLDQSWRTRSRAMTPETVKVAAARIAEHAAAHQLRRVRIVLHGGEPLLLGLAGMRTTLAELRAAIEPVTTVDLRMQSNGVLLTEAFCDLLAEFDVHVGISIDGDRTANDRHRRFANGASSYDQVLRALALLRRPEYQRIFAGLLCTVDVRNDPITVYEALVAQEPPRIDFLLPHSTWDDPPPRPTDDQTPYHSFLACIYDRWRRDGQPVRVRLFESLMSTAEGGPSGSEWVGLDPADIAVIETDGEWEQADSLKITFDGAPATGMSVFTHSADEVSVLPGVARRQHGMADLSATCRACPVVRQCGGGLFAHRYRTGNGFDNPSVFCADLKEFILHMNVDMPRPQPPSSMAPAAGSSLPPLLDEIGRGYGTEAAVTYLADAELSITRVLLAAVADAATGQGDIPVGWRLLSDLDRVAPDAVRSVLAHPYVRPWAVRCLDKTAGAAPTELAYLCSLAAAAAVGAGAQADFPVPVHRGRVHLPTVGTVEVPDAKGTAVVAVSGESFTVRAGDDVIHVGPGDSPPAAGWRPATWLTIDGVRVLLEDHDPNRDCHQWTPSDPLDDDARRAWAESLAAAWQLIQDEAPAYLPGLRAGLKAVVPLQADPTGQLRASTARHAFGAIGAAPASPEALAVMLVHEFQHGKLGAILDLYDLFDDGYRSMLRVGWREDPRPIEGVIQGTYAHLAVADIWRGRSMRQGPDGPPAYATYRQYRDWTVAGIDALRQTCALTPAGDRIVDRMADTVTAWSA
jgi:uncharacterized protein